MSCIEENTCDVVKTFRRPGIVPPSLRPWWYTSRQSAQLWNSQSPECRTTSPNWENTTTLVRPCIQNAPRKTGEANPAGYTHGKRAQMSSKDQVEWLHLQPCLVPSWCGASRTIWNACWLWGIPSPRAGSPATPLTEKQAWKLMTFSLVYSPVFKSAQIESEQVPQTIRIDWYQRSDG